MILFTTLLVMLLALLMVFLIGGAGLILTLGDVIICAGIIVLLVKLFKKWKS